MDFLDRIKAAIPDSISLRDIPAPLRPLAVVAAPLINRTGLTTITANSPAHKPASSPPSVAVKPIPKVPEPSIGGFIKETILPAIGRNVALPIALATAPAQPVLAEARDFVQDRAAGKPLSINVTSIGNPIMMAADAVGIGKPLRHGTADLVNGTVETILEGVDWLAGERRDQGMAGPTAQWLEERRRDMARLTGDGDYAIYNGAGWSHQGKEGGLTSIFVRQADGNSVMLRPGQAEYWQHMLPYAAPTILSMFYGGGEAKGAAGAFKAASTMEMAGGIAVIGSEFNQVITLKPEAYRTLSNLVRDPSLLNDPDAMRDIMNDVFGEYGRKEGSMAGPVYIPSLRDGTDPYRMLQQLSLGSVQAHQRATPFESFDGKPLSQHIIADLRDNLLQDPTFTLAIDKLAMRSLAGEDLQPSELAVLRFGLNIRHEQSFSLDPNHLEAGAQAETNQALRMAYGENIAQAQAEKRARDEGGTDDDVMLAVDHAAEKFQASGGKSVPDAVIVQELKVHTAAEAVRIEQERQETMRRLERESIDISIQPKL